VFAVVLNAFCEQGRYMTDTAADSKVRQLVLWRSSL